MSLEIRGPVTSSRMAQQQTSLTQLSAAPFPHCRAAHIHYQVTFETLRALSCLSLPFLVMTVASTSHVLLTACNVI